MATNCAASVRTMASDAICSACGLRSMLPLLNPTGSIAGIPEERVVIVMKFGGTSLSDPSRIQNAAALVRGVDGPKAVVASAMGGVTDRLLAAGAAAERGETAWSQKLYCCLMKKTQPA